ncbi:BglG family transcription antiterminator [Enterococcus rivorum]|uniref:PTS system EIIA component n=1 Tax=Enterococcus rivorum TaxID=762845 RepID=A0A1E5KUT6_9ENTE|nr:BglG family transcription antiterminator [Enterococcus rivorum]MBP2100510.1 transcriptional antiterminator/mannitol/fructose-specific phosphotransferase system IIA component (Ntr-type) [Enterococcus rivorum]OEH81634.1 hypothetical protein BCR26_16065 [Enterococcus rivorum]
MNRRINKIILDILHDKKNTLQGYAQLFKVSEQTIRNDIKEINDHFREHNQAQIVLNEAGLLMMTSKVDLKETLKAYASFQNYNLSQDERRTILALLLITLNDYVTTYFLSEYVLVSRNTLVSDVEELKVWFNRNGLMLESYIGKGYLIKGDEIKIRKAMLKLIIYNGLFDQEYEYAFGMENNIFQNLLLDIIDKSTIYQSIKKIILTAERQCNLQLSDFSYQEVSCYLLIMIERIRMGKVIEVSPQLNNLKDSSKFLFSKEIVNFVEKKYDLNVSSGEMLSLTSILRSKSYIKNNARKIDSIEIQILINEFIFNISKELRIKYYLNSDLFELLENHLKLLIYRIKQKSSVKNALFEEVYASYQEIFPIVKENLVKIESFLDVEISEDEVSFIVMYIMAILENNTSTQPPIRVRLICNSGRGTAQLLKAKLNSTFPQVEIISVDSSHVLQQLNPETQDLIISTVPIKTEASNFVLVHPILTEKDIVELQKAIYQTKLKRLSVSQKVTKQINREQALYQNYRTVINKYIDEEHRNAVFSELEELHSLYSNQEIASECPKEVERLSEILTIERIDLHCSANSWQEAVKSAGALLHKSRLITGQYIQAMINVVEVNDSYVVISPGIAIPHAEASDGALKTGASFIRLNEPVCFNHKKNDPVKYVIAFSIAEGTGIGSCLYYFTEILATEAFISTMNRCESELEMLVELKKMEDKVMGLSYEKNIM